MLSVIIPAYNCESDIDPLLAGVRRTRLRDIEVLLIDDGSTDGTAARAAAHPGVTVMRLPRNGGPARARNVGAARAKGDVLVFLDADVVLSREVDVLAEMERIFRERPAVDCVGSVTHPRPLRENAIAYNNSIYHAYHMDRVFAGRDVVEGRVMCFTTRLGGIRRERFRASGGFHESLFAVMNEDGEFGTRCYHLGYVSYFDRRLVHYHRYPTDFRRYGRSYFRNAMIQALVDRRMDTTPDLSVHGVEKLRRLFALALWGLPALLLWMPAGAWAASALASAAAFVACFGELGRLVRRHVPARRWVGWTLVYVAITPAIIAGYLWGLVLDRAGTSLLAGPPSRDPFFEGAP